MLVDEYLAIDAANASIPFDLLINSLSNNDYSIKVKNITSKSYMRGYRDIYNYVSGIHKLMIRFCDSFVKMIIVKIEF